MTFDNNLVIVIFLVILATVDLTVGVANDAVNFLNSAIGSKAAKFKTALTVAAFGVLAGVFFSSGMMEVARSVIFKPDLFNLNEVLIIFLAVMYTDVLLLDIFNTFGLPTSTTVSIIFGLLGSAMGMSLVKVLNSGENFTAIFEYLNTSSIFAIVIAIVSSVFFAFIFGYLFQYITRMIFTFDYLERFKKYGAIWSGFALTMLTLFIVLKGAKGASFIPPDFINYVKNNMLMLSGMAVVAWYIIIQLLMWITKIDMLKVIVMIGTFGLALAFAANDLVNFIGAPMAGLNAYTYSLTQTGDLASLTMDVLNEPVKADFWILLSAGIIMVATLFFSKKAQHVAMTEINLGRQDDGFERFESNLVARFLVRSAIGFFEIIQKITPNSLQKWVSSRFDVSKYKPQVIEGEHAASFDLVRAAVILVISSGLISFATSLKLPLSTTYVTFIVAMAAALPDKAWGRDSAVFRVAGVLTVITGWFFTAFIAALVGFVICITLFYTSIFGVVGFGALVTFALIRTGQFHKKQNKEEQEKIEKLLLLKENPNNLLESTFSQTIDILDKASNIINKSYKALLGNSLKSLVKSNKLSVILDSDVQIFIKNSLRMFKENVNRYPDNLYDYTKTAISYQDLADRLLIISRQNYKYISNNHNKFSEVQIAELNALIALFKQYCNVIIKLISTKNFSSNTSITTLKKEIILLINELNTNQLMRFKVAQGSSKRNMVFLHIITDMEYLTNLLEHIYNGCGQLFEYYLFTKDMENINNQN